MKISCSQNSGRVRGMGNLYAVDFDGVICDSSRESSLSAVKAAKVRWPHLFKDVDQGTEGLIVDQMHFVRPVVETGYENVLLARLLLEIQLPSIRQSSVADGLTYEQILESWLSFKPVIMREWGQNSEDLMEFFGKIRAEWMENSLSDWISANRLYPGIADALAFASSKIYIVTTKSSMLVDILLRKLAGIAFPSDRIYGLGSGPKVEVLKKLKKESENIGLTFHFVEDRLATLMNVMEDPELDEWNLYLSKWGYNTQKEREVAERISRINLLDLTDFCSKLK